MTKAFYEFFCPVKIIAGHKALEHIPFELSALSVERPLIVTDKGVRGVGLLSHIENVFAAAGLPIPVIFDDVPPDSSLHTVRNATAVYRDNDCDAIIAIGGGSVIDTSKALNVLASEGGDDLLKYSGAHNLKRPLKPLFVIPTTSGTGSEVTMVAMISDTEKGVKIPFTSYFLLPNAAVLDPRMTLTLPPHITAMTAMDALTHAIEAYTCMAANPMSDAYATAAVQKIVGNILKVMDHPHDADGRLELAQASTMAGIAFSNSMVGMVHALGHSIGAVCHLPHGLCMSLLLPYVLEYNQDAIAERLGQLLLPLAGAEFYAATPAASRAIRSILVIRQLRDDLYARCKLPRTLQETGKVKQEQLEQIVEVAINDGSLIYNPKEADRPDLLAVLKAAWA
ncbi:MAG TPA: iron-containing alcohol dehydrogenase [Rhodocyclaceae bacterium]|nr:iron-containing alcohol dehydrogenase [Rhodocyclaceae bacterium]